MVTYFSTTDAAKMLKCSEATVRRVAKRHAMGVMVSRNRLVALTTKDVDSLKGLIHPTAGNPLWIARARERAAG